MAQALEAAATGADIGDAGRAGYRVVITPAGRRIRAIVRGQSIADSTDVLVMHETRLKPAYYFLKDDVAMEWLTRTTHRTHCPFKGDASYWTLRIGDVQVDNAAWSYEEPFDEAAAVKGRLAFDWDSVDTWLADDDVLAPPPRDNTPARANPFVDWLVQYAWRATSLPDAVQRLADVLVVNGMPLWRLRLLIRTLNPQLFAETYTWQQGADTVMRVQVPHERLHSPVYLNSPFALIIDGQGGVRRHLDGPRPQLDFPVLHDLKAEGATDYVAMPLTFSDGQINIITLVSAAHGGFSTAHLGQLYEILPSLGRHLEALAQRVSSLTLLRTYLGASAGERVMSGLVKRGDGSEVNAVIWFSDLRDSTALAEAMPRDDYLATLNAYFDSVAGAVLDHGGEVLKFIGDAVLAIFAIERPSDCTGEACARALDAVRDAQARMAAVNRERRARDAPTLTFGTALHVGTITYGNIGTTGRLDFTVIGPAVNEASRIEDLCKRLDEPVLASAAFARHVPGAPRSVGRHELRGVAGVTEVFALAGEG